MKENLNKDTLLYGLCCPDDLLRRECWRYFCEHYSHDKNSCCNAAKIDFNLKDSIGKPVYSKSEMYDAFLVMLLNNPQASQGNDFVSLLLCEQNYNLSIPYLIDIVCRVDSLMLQEECIPLLRSRIRLNSNMLYLIKLLENVDESNYHRILPIVIQELSHICLDYVSISQVHQLLQNRFLREPNFRKYGFEILKQLVTHQVHPFTEHRALLWQSFILGIRYNPQFYDEYLDLFRNLVLKIYKNLEFHNLRLIIRESSSLFNNGCFKIQHLIDILSAIKEELLQVQKSSALFWNDETYNLVFKWLEQHILDSDDYAAHALPLLQHLACQMRPSQKIKLYRLVEKVLYSRLLANSYRTHGRNLNNFCWNNFFFSRQDCPDFISSYAMILSAILPDCRQEVNEQSFLEMSRCLSNSNHADIQTTGTKLLSSYLQLPGQTNLIFEHLGLGAYSFAISRFICWQLRQIQLQQNGLDHKYLISFIHYMMYNISDRAIRDLMFQTAQNLFDLYKESFSPEELQNYQNICNIYHNKMVDNMHLYQQLKTYFKR